MSLPIPLAFFGRFCHHLNLELVAIVRELVRCKHGLAPLPLLGCRQVYDDDTRRERHRQAGSAQFANLLNRPPRESVRALYISTSPVVFFLPLADRGLFRVLPKDHLTALHMAAPYSTPNISS